MGHEDRESAVPHSIVPETDMIDASWDDDDLVSSVALSHPAADSTDEEDDPADRVTVVPDNQPSPLELLDGTDSSRPTPSFHDRQTPAEFPASPPGKPPSLEMPFDETHFQDEVATAPVPGPDDLELDLGELPDLDLDAGDRSASLPQPPPASSAAPEPDPAVSEMKDRYAMGDFTGALVIAESLLETDPGDAESLRYADSCRDVLTQMYAARLGALDQVVVVAIPPDQIRWLSLDHRAGFLLSMVDGTSSVEEILDVIGMTRLDALRIMFTLLEQRIIRLDPPG
jgi:hypothetical protein